MSYSFPEYERVIVNSSLWATAGDALGWITELSRGVEEVRRRTGSGKVTKPVKWQRFIGGNSGVMVDLPAGTYSDDTQLRLCVSRSIRGNGDFDVEAFAKVEVPSWQGYCLGAGVGSKAAAVNLSNQNVNWYSNFFDKKGKGGKKYTEAGGNGAAMRIQPHVWSANGSRDEMIVRVMRDAIVTHGHPHGFCGAVFHALCIWHALSEREMPSIEIADEFIECIGRLPSILKHDRELTDFWKQSWEIQFGSSLEDAVDAFKREALNDISLVRPAFESKGFLDYRDADFHDILTRLKCLTGKYRGSGFKTALAALLLAMLYSADDIADALILVANELECDTDTIATMSGAILGILARGKPEWKIQDSEYVASQARRMACIASGENADSFRYPDLSRWKPPINQSDAVVMSEGSFVLRGIGKLEPQSREYVSRSSVWQWFRLPFGQSVLGKRRSGVRSFARKSKIVPESLSRKSKRMEMKDPAKMDPVDGEDNREDDKRRNLNMHVRARTHDEFFGVDKATDDIIASNFDDATIGRAINQCIDATGSIETVAALSAIIAKARLVRIKVKARRAQDVERAHLSE